MFESRNLSAEIFYINAGRLVEFDAVELHGRRQMRRELFPNRDGQVFGAAHFVFHEVDINIQVLMVEPVDHMFLDELAQFLYIVQEAGIGIGRALDRNIQVIIVPMPIFIGAYPEYLLILFPAPCRVKKLVCRVEMLLPG